MSIGRCAPLNTILRHRGGELQQSKLCRAYRYVPGTTAKIAWRRTIVRALASEDSSGDQTAELRRNQKELEDTLAELAKVANRLSEEDRKKLAAVIAELGPLEDGEDEGGQAEYPKPVQDLYDMAGVLDAVPYDGSPVIKDSKDLPLMPKLSPYQWSEEDVKDSGEELTDKEWAEFFARELGYDGGDDSNSGGESTFPDDSNIPPSFVDDEVKPGDDVEIQPSPDVEAMLALLESGQPLPPDPREAGIKREDAATFRARLDKIVARYESQFLKRHEWQITTKEIREMGERWNALAMTSETPATMDDITEVVPAPDFPPEVQQQWDRCQWILYRLRRAHIDGPPAQPALALASAGLVSEDVIFRDAVLECRGLPAWLEYAQRLDQTGGYIELANIWGSASEDRPDPQWHVVVDSWLNIPYPDWYLDYFMTHFDASRNPQAFLGAFAAAMTDSGKETPEYLKPYAEWAEGMRRPPKRQKRIPLLSRDAYEGRPLSLKQRLRTGSVPVVEANPSLSIDDTDAQGRPLPGIERPLTTSSFRAAEFVADPGLGKAPFSRAARDPYSGGRNLLLPLFRHLQQRSARLLSLVQLIRSVLHTASGEDMLALAATDINSAPHAGSDQESTSGVSRGEGHQDDYDIADHDHTSEDAITEQESAKDSNTGAQSDSSSQTQKQRYSVSAVEALDAAGRTIKEWQRQRAEHISWRFKEESSSEGSATDTSSHAAESTGEGASILEKLRSSWRKVKPGVSVWEAPGVSVRLGALLPRLSELAGQGDSTAQQLVDLAQKRERFLHRERPKQTAIVGDTPTETPPSAKPGAAPNAAHTAAAVLAGDELEAAVFSATAQRVREERRGGEKSQAEHRRSRWSRRSLSCSTEGGPSLKLLGVADLSATSDRVRTVAEGEATFASATGGQPKPHRYRLLLPHPRSALAAQTRLQRAGDSAVAGTPSSVLGTREEIGNDASAGGARLEQQQEQQQVECEGLAGAQSGRVPSGSAAAAAAARLGLRPGAGSRYFPPEPAPPPAIPDLVGLFLGDSADSFDVSADSDADVSTDITHDSGADSNTAESTASDGKAGAQAGKSSAARSRSSERTAEEEGEQQQSPLGMAWRDGRYLTIPMTTLYELNVETGQVDRITCHWNGIIAHVLGGPEDARDVYVRLTRLHDLMYRPGFRICYRDLDLTTIPAEDAMDMS